MTPGVLTQLNYGMIRKQELRNLFADAVGSRGGQGARLRQGRMGKWCRRMGFRSGGRTRIRRMVSGGSLTVSNHPLVVGAIICNFRPIENDL